jgi:hypothetical protein
MVNQDELAAALLAKLASTELQSVDINTTQAPSSGRANRLNPMAFVTEIQQRSQQHQQQNQQAILEQLNRQAEAQFPLPPPVTIPVSAPVSEPARAPELSITNIELIEVLRNINQSLVDIKEVLATIGASFNGA